MPQTIAGNSAGNDASALRQKIPQEPNVFKIDGAFFDAKPTRAATLKKSAASTTASAIASSTAAAAFTFHNLPFTYCGSSYS
jgi:hypothetical protein